MRNTEKKTVRFFMGNSDGLFQKSGMKEECENDEQRLKDHVSGENRGGEPDLPGHAVHGPQCDRINADEQQKNGNAEQIEPAQDIARDLGDSAFHECNTDHEQKKGKRMQQRQNA